MAKDMQVKRLQGIFSWVVVLSEMSHVFCCVLPSIFSLLTIMVGLGVMGAVPLWMSGTHEVMHAWEVPIMVMSGVILVLGWSLHVISKKMDCHNTGCGHEPCGPKKKNTGRVLRIATFLFAINILVYVSVHLPAQRHNHQIELQATQVQTHDAEHDHQH